MAVKWAIISGNWSNPAIWNGGTKPQAGDVVHSNGYYITMDEALITVDKVTNGPDVGLGIITGGYFAYAAAGSAVLNANSENHSTYNILTNNNGPLLINGNSINLGSGVYGVYINASAFPVTINGNADATNSSGCAVAVWGNGGLNVTGSSTGSSLAFSQAYAGIVVFSGGGSVTIGGNLIATGAPGLTINTSNNSLNVVNGDVFANTTIPGLYIINYPVRVEVNGYANPSNSTYAIYNAYPQAQLVVKKIKSIISAEAAVFGVSGYFRMAQTGSEIKVILKDGTEGVLTVGGEVSGQLPVEADVRAGVDFALGTKTGTCSVPPKESVGFGVLVDDTEGEAVFSFADWLAALTASNDPIAQRLKNVATPESVAAQIETSLNG
jgi:hypothetical protein